MPIAFIIIGIMLVVTGAQDTHVQFGRQVVSDITGKKGFAVWMLAIWFIGAIGAVESLRPLSKAFMTLIIVGIILANPAFFTNFLAAVQQGPISPQPVQNSQGLGSAITSAATGAAKAGGNAVAETSTSAALSSGNTFMNAGFALFKFLGF